MSEEQTKLWLANVSLALKGIYIHMVNASGPDWHLPANGSLLRDGRPAVGGFFHRS